MAASPLDVVPVDVKVYWKAKQEGYKRFSEIKTQRTKNLRQTKAAPKHERVTPWDIPDIPDMSEDTISSIPFPPQPLRRVASYHPGAFAASAINEAVVPAREGDS